MLFSFSRSFDSFSSSHGNNRLSASAAAGERVVGDNDKDADDVVSASAGIAF